MNHYVLTFQSPEAAGVFIHGMNSAIETHLAGEDIFAKMERKIPCTSIVMSYGKLGLTTAQEVSEAEYTERLASSAL